MPDVLATIAQGIIAHPGNRPKKAEFSFESGAKLVLEGEILQMWFNAYVAMIQTFNMLANQETPAADSRQVRNFLRDKEKEFNKNRPKATDDDQE